MSIRYPAATWRPVTYASQARQFAAPVRGWVLHVVVGSGSPWPTFEHAAAGDRRFSHLWVARDGSVEQYQDLDREAWAAVAGNTSWWHVETEGYPTEPLTYAQMEALARWHVWSQAPDELAATPSGYGIGTHAMGGAAWGGHNCPDPRPGLPGPRSKQRQMILDTAKTIRRSDMPLTAEDIRSVVAAVWGATVNGADDASVGTKLDRLYQSSLRGAPVSLSVEQVDGLAAATAARILATGGAALAEAVADELARRLQS